MKTFLATCFAFLFALAPAMAADLPPLKAGLWKVSTDDGGQSKNIEYCMDDSTMKEMLSLSSNIAKGMCDDLAIKKVSEQSFTSSISCKIMGSNLSVRSAIHGDFSTHYESTTTIKYSPPIMGKSEEISKSSAVYAGACPVGMKAGEFKTQEGQIINPNEMMKNLPDTSKMMEGLQGGKMPSPEEMQQLMEQMQQFQKSAGKP